MMMCWVECKWSGFHGWWRLKIIKSVGNSTQTCSQKVKEAESKCIYVYGELRENMRKKKKQNFTESTTKRKWDRE